MNVELARLRAGSVPKLCARTGVPTPHLRRQWLVCWQRGSYWWLLLGGGAWLIASAVRSSAVQVDLPIAAAVRSRYALRRALRVAGVVFVLYLLGRYPFLPALAAGVLLWWPLNVWTKGGWVSARWNGRFVRLQHAHPAFLDALRAARVPGLPEWQPGGESTPVSVLPFQLVRSFAPGEAYQPVPPPESYGYVQAVPYAPRPPELVPQPVPVPEPVPAGPAAGWYADPAGAHAMRYWDGAAWTEHLTPYAAAAGA